ncbi:ABC transporter substrate-binding protein [Lederbergia wuyishanensis]|uniref:Multiple sugar transport system substrate-binding protein n=1 Tax=Lederbergia wuyishanensis TaxID=1347903 RepID=A0ABU0D9D4_9BACI|nr:extracellular solute-binding protein [Lederbergia wuyishanensis]MCJ8009408.1 extracellular solute-binding protein [Lederbergia wuyishanensis]MDQ0344983.1 multiple sugar transport system substrate-binding protein [Lederbergia wuyishanensis]
MNIKIKGILGTMLLLIFVILSACSNETSTPKKEKKKDDVDSAVFSEEEVTLKIATPWGEEYFMDRIGNYVKENKPYLTLEHIDWDGSAEQLQEFYADKKVPDVLLAFTGQQPLEELDSVFPLDEMIDLYHVDLNHIQPVVLDEVRSRDKERRLIGIPGEVGLLGLYYNKEVFDIFGVPYPEPDESMSWDRVLDLAKQMTAVRNDVHYCGLDMGDQDWAPLMELSVSKTDPETGEVLLTKDPKFAKYMGLMEQYYGIPGIKEESCGFGERNVAMYIGWHGFMANNWLGGEIEDAVEFMKDMDILPLPTWSDMPDVGPTPTGIHPFVINNYSENKDAALQFLLTVASEDYQLKLSRDGTPSVLYSQESIEQYAANNIFLNGKNIKALFHNTPAAPPEIKSVWDQYVELDMKKFVESGADIQEFLRVSQEEAEIKIQDAKQAQ